VVADGDLGVTTAGGGGSAVRVSDVDDPLITNAVTAATAAAVAPTGPG
jgi:hypothetical protein